MRKVDFWQNLNFSSANEDGATECQVLAGARRILCLTGSGTRPLDMLLAGAEEVIALDVNPAQNALLALKAAAIAACDHAEYLAFVGVTPSTTRLAVYDRLRPGLAADVQLYWDGRRRMIGKGLWYAGKWEKLLAWNARFLWLFRGRSVTALLAARTVEEQAQIWRTRFDDSKLRRAIEMIGRDWVWRWVMREPGGEFLPPPAEVSRRLAEDFATAAGTFLFRDSDFAMLALRGRHEAAGALPLHMLAGNYGRTRAELPKLRILQGGLTDGVALGLEEVDGFSLSDFGSYCSGAVYAACWQGAMDVAAPGARFVERVFMNDLPLPFDGLVEDRDASARLSRSDRAIIYRVRAGRIGQG